MKWPPLAYCASNPYAEGLEEGGQPLAGGTISQAPVCVKECLTVPQIEISLVVEQKIADPDGTEVHLTVRMGQGPWRGVACRLLMNESVFPVMSSVL